MKFTLLTVSMVFLTGCATVDQMVCYGAGTCYKTAEGSWEKACSEKYPCSVGSVPGSVRSGGMNLPTNITTSSGNYLIVPNYSGGLPAAIIRTSK
jgi:hypothetical protein